MIYNSIGSWCTVYWGGGYVIARYSGQTCSAIWVCKYSWRSWVIPGSFRIQGRRADLPLGIVVPFWRREIFFLVPSQTCFTSALPPIYSEKVKCWSFRMPLSGVKSFANITSHFLHSHRYSWDTLVFDGWWTISDSCRTVTTSLQWYSFFMRPKFPSTMQQVKVWLSCFYQSELSTLDNLECLILAYTVICVTVARLFMQEICFTIMMYHWNDSIWTTCFWSIWTNTFWFIGQVIHLLLVSIITYSKQSYFQRNFEMQWSNLSSMVRNLQHLAKSKV